MAGPIDCGCARHCPGGDPLTTLWFVTVRVAGAAREPAEVRAALERLSAERPFVSAAWYGADRAEVQYWDECPDVATATALALRMWTDHESSAVLPPWQVSGLEVVDQATAVRRHDRRYRHLRAFGEIRPMLD